MQRKSAFSLSTATAALAIFAAFAGAPAAHAASADCFNQVQGRIAWDYQGNRQWAPQNINRLCEGSAQPSQPPACFDRVMHGGINWGGSVNWQWENALNLCAATNYSDATIACFQTRLRQGDPWATAINTCKGPLIRSAPSSQSVILSLQNRSGAPVQIYWLDFQGTPQTYGVLSPGESRDQQTFSGHIWQLVQDGRIVSRFVANGDPRQSKTVNSTDVGEGPIWSTVDAQQKCPTICNRLARTWDGAWTTTIEGRWSVCQCVAVN